MKANAPKIGKGGKHTPGPWKVTGGEIWGGDKRIAPWGGAYGPKDRTTNMANARLIAASPRLLTAAKQLVAYLGPWIEDYAPDESQAVALEEMRAAISEAEG